MQHNTPMKLTYSLVFAILAVCSGLAHAQPYPNTPARTPAAIIGKLNTELAAALRSPEVKALLATDGSEVVASSPERFSAIIRAEFARWGPVVKESGAKID